MTAAQPALPGLGPEVCPDCGAPPDGHDGAQVDDLAELAYAARRLRAVETVSVSGGRL